MTDSVSRLFDRFSGLKALSIGHVTHDFYGDRILPGGCAFYGARTLRALGAESKLATAVGRDFACREELDGIDVSSQECEETTIFTNLYPKGKPRVQLVSAQARDVDPLPGKEDFYSSDMVFIAPVMAEVDHKKWRAIRGKKITALGLQGFLKHAPRTDLSQKRLVVPTGDAFDKQLLDGVDAVFFSEEDMALFGPAGLLDDLLSTVNLVFMTRGEKGCSVFSNRGSFDVRTYQTNAIDPTGAGDTFAAAAALALAAGGSPRQAAGIGAAAASIVVEGMGGECLGRVENTLRRALELC